MTSSTTATAAGVPCMLEDLLLSAVSKHGSLNSRQAHAEFGIPQRLAKETLCKLVETGQLQVQGKSRWTRYLPTDAQVSSEPEGYKWLRPYVLQVLGRMTGFQPDRVVARDVFTDKVLQAIGVNPGQWPTDWVPRGSITPMAMDRRIHCVYQSLKRCSTPLTLDASDVGTCQFGLTKAGAAAAWDLCADELEVLKEKLDGNLTRGFLLKRFGTGPLEESDLYQRFARAITTKLLISARIQLVDDHIQNFLSKLIRLDSLRSRILRGQTIPNSLLVSWAIGSARTDARNTGVEPVCRSLYGAFTEREREHMEKGTFSPKIAAYPAKTHAKDKGWSRRGMNIWIQGSGTDQFDIQDKLPTPEDTCADADFVANLQMTCERAIRRKAHKGTRDRYCLISRLLIRGLKAVDIAEHLGVSKSRANSLINSVRNILRGARAKGQFSAVLA